MQDFIFRFSAYVFSYFIFYLYLLSLQYVDSNF